MSATVTILGVWVLIILHVFGKIVFAFCAGYGAFQIVRDWLHHYRERDGLAAQSDDEGA